MYKFPGRLFRVVELSIEDCFKYFHEFLEIAKTTYLNIQDNNFVYFPKIVVNDSCIITGYYNNTTIVKYFADNKELSVVNGYEIHGNALSVFKVVSTLVLLFEKVVSDSLSVGVIGYGNINSILLEALRRKVLTLRISKIVLHQKHFKTTNHIPNIEYCRNEDEILKSSNIIITATTATLPVINYSPGLQGKLICSVGWMDYKSREIPKEFFQEAKIILVDNKYTVLKESCEIREFRQGHSKIVELKELLKGNETIKLGPDEIYVFKSVGIPHLDMEFFKHIMKKKQC